MDAGPGVTGVAAGESQGSESHVTRGGGGGAGIVQPVFSSNAFV